MSQDIEKFTSTETRENQATKLNKLKSAVEAGGGGSGDPVTWDAVADKPATFPPVIGTTASTAKAGNWVPAIADVTGLQAALDALGDRIAALEEPSAG